LYANQAGTATSASHALYADQAGTAQTATSASYALTASFAANATIPTLQQVTDEGNTTTNSIEVTGSISVGNGLGFPVSQTATLDGRSLRVSSGTRFTDLRAYGGTTLTSSVLTIRDQSGFLFIEPTSTINNGLALLSGPDGLTNNQMLVGPVNTTMSKPLQMLNNSAITASGDMLMTNPNGNQRITFTGSQNVVLKGHPDFLTTFDESGLFGVDRVSTSVLKLDPTDGGGGNYDKSITFTANRLEMRGAVGGVGIYGNGTDAATSEIRFVPKNTYMASFKDASVQITAPITASIISASGGFVGDGFGLTNLPYAGQNKFFDENTYTFDLPGDANDAAYDIHISQSGLYFISASKQPPYGGNGPKVNLYYWPELIQIGGTAKVTFFIPNADTGNGISYKENITGSASNQWYWSSTTSPASTSTRNIARNVTYSSIATGAGTTTMIKDASGKAFFLSSVNSINSTNYLYTGDSVNPLT
jgi:hypothetical protein